MNVFTNLYFISIIGHTIFYLLIIYIICHIFNIKMKGGTYTNIIILLIVIMIMGYVGRLYRSKNIFHYKVQESNDSVQSIQDTLELMHKGYFKYYFLG